MPTIVRTPRLVVRYGSSVGVEPDTTLSNVFSARGSVQFNPMYAQAEFRFPGPVEGTGLDFWTRVDIAVDAGSWAPAAPPIRFQGYIEPKGFHYELWPREVRVTCVGKLYKVTQVPPALDTDDPDVPGISLAGMTDQATSRFALDHCGLSGHYSPAAIGGLGIAFGTETAPGAKGSATQFVWERNTTGEAILQRYDAVCLGFRTVETLKADGTGLQIVRRRISPRPTLTAVTGDLLFAEGVDIFRGSAGHQADAISRLTGVGFDDGTSPLRLTVSAGHPHPMPGVSHVSKTLTSSMIEKKYASDPGQGLSMQDYLNWQLLELCQVRLFPEFSTPRDPLVGPGTTIGVYTPGRLEIAQNVHVNGVNWEYDQHGAFTQSFKCSSPAAVGRGGAALASELGIYGFVGLGV